MATKNIFLSYRRDDTEGQAGRLFEALRAEFGAEHVFMDVATLEPGLDFRRAIERGTSDCGVLLALIGRDWLTLTNDKGQRRIDDPDDFVRLETANALKRDIPVVPVLVHGAQMPRSDQLPDELRNLAFRNAVELSHARWESDVKLLIAALHRQLGGGAAKHKRRWLLPAGGLAALACAGAAAFVLWPRELELPATAAGPTAGHCIKGFVWREARPGDRVCVVPKRRAITANENQLAASRRAPGGGAYGPDTCQTGYVWREAFDGDTVCVIPESRDQAARDNRASPTRIVLGPAAAAE